MIWAPRHGLTASVGIVVAVVLALAAGLPDPWWAAISAWMVANPDRTAIVSKSILRLIGTVAGCLVGYGTSVFLGDRPPLVLVVVFLCGYVGARGRFVSAYSYAWVLFGITSMMLLIAGLEQTSGLFEFAVARAFEITCGVLGALVASIVLGVGGPGHSLFGPAPAVDGDHDFDIDRVALIGGLVGVVIAVTWSWLDLPAASQIAVTSYVLVDRDLGSSRIRALQRIAGCLLGAATGVLAISLGIESLLMWLWLLAAGIFFFSSLHLGGGPYAYVGTQAGIAYIISLVTGPAYPTDISAIVQRLVGVLLGVVLAITLAQILAPSRPPREEGA